MRILKIQLKIPINKHYPMCLCSECLYGRPPEEDDMEPETVLPGSVDK